MTVFHISKLRQFQTLPPFVNKYVYLFSLLIIVPWRFSVTSPNLQNSKFKYLLGGHVIFIEISFILRTGWNCTLPGGHIELCQY